MASRLLARRLVRTGCACATLAALLAGCTTSSSSSSSGSSITGTTLRIYMSVPPGTLSPEAKDVLLAETLAFNQSRRRAGKFTIRLVRFAGRELSDNARQAIGDTTTIAYLGEIVPGTSADSIGITNAQDVLQVSPTDTAGELTQSTPAIANTPDRYYESLSTNGRTFARLVPTDALEAEAAVTYMRALGINRVYVANDGSEYGRALKATFVKQAGSALSIVGSDATADAVFYAGSSASSAAQVFDRAAASNPKVALFAPSALEENSFVAALSPAAQKQLFVSSPGFTSAAAPDPAFASAFRTAYGHPPATQAVFGYAAMQAVIHALRQAGSSAGNRSTVVHDFLAIRNLDTGAGPITMDKHGDVSFRGGPPLVFSRVRGGKLVPVKAAHG